MDGLRPLWVRAVTKSLLKTAYRANKIAHMFYDFKLEMGGLMG